MKIGKRPKTMKTKKSAPMDVSSVFKKRWVPDTSVIIHGKLSELISKDKLMGTIIIPGAVIDELQAQASKGLEIGFEGLEELKLIRKLIKSGKKIKLNFIGRRPTMEEIKLAKKGRIDALIRDIANEQKATLITADYVQALVADVEGVSVLYTPPEEPVSKSKLEDLFGDMVSSIHLKSGVVPLCKKGLPGDIKLVEIRKTPCTGEEIEALIRDIMKKTRNGEAVIEIGSRGALVIQLNEYRIAIARPPFSDALELTVVKPIAKLTLKDYKLSKKLMERLEAKAEGILVCGPPGSGKSTFAASLAEFYMSREKIVKTMEKPKDLQVPPEITQYGALNGSFEKTADILLLVRPDYTIFDEVRKTTDFEIFTDMRLAGVGMVGVVHSSSAVDAVQRFMGRIELGMISSVLDTIIFIKDGKVKDVFYVKLTVRVPTGMTEADLARPVVEIRDFETNECKYEVYTYGEENVIMPVSKEERIEPIKKLALERILQEMKKFDTNAQAEILSENKVVVRVDNEVIPKLIGRGGETINKLEKQLGISIDVEPLVKALGKSISHKITESGPYLVFEFNKEYFGKMVTIYIESQFLFSATVGKRGIIRVSKDSDLGLQLMRALVGRREIRTFL